MRRDMAMHMASSLYPLHDAADVPRRAHGRLWHTITYQLARDIEAHRQRGAEPGR